MKTHLGIVALAAALTLSTLLCAGCSGSNESTDFVDIGEVKASATPAFTGNGTESGEAEAGEANAAETVDPESYIPADATPDPNATPTPTPEIDSSTLNGEDDATPAPQKTYAEYRSLNSDVVGWINVPDTSVDYPILHGTDNEYYLTHSVEKTSSKSGAIFLDAKSSVNARYAVIFGHNMKNGTMFHGLYDYLNYDFYKNHRTFTIKWGDKTYTYKVFAVYTVDEKAAKYWYQDRHFKSEDGTFDNATFAYTMNELAKNSKFDVDVTIKETDRVITLSTCNRTDYANGRFAIHAVLVDG